MSAPLQATDRDSGARKQDDNLVYALAVAVQKLIAAVISINAPAGIHQPPITTYDSLNPPAGEINAINAHRHPLRQPLFELSETIAGRLTAGVGPILSARGNPRLSDEIATWARESVQIFRRYIGRVIAPELLESWLQRGGDYVTKLMRVHGGASSQAFLSLHPGMDRLETSVERDLEREASHSPDFTSVNWFGTEYTFKPGREADVVRVLWEAWNSRNPCLNQVTIGEMIQSNDDHFRLSNVFRNHPAFRKMIVSNAKGVFTLQQPTKKR